MIEGKELVSVIIPAYNGEKVIGDCLDSLKSQDFKGGKEIIVVDDGSRDRTAEIARERGVVVLNQENKGPAAARNLGLRRAMGEIVLFTDADCIPEKNWITEMVRPFEDKEVGGVQGIYRTKQSLLVARFGQIEIEDRYRRMGRRDSIDFIGTYSAGYRKSEIGKGFDEGFRAASGEDAELSYRISREKRLVFNPSAIVFHRHPESLGKYLRTKFYRAYWRMPVYKKHSKKMVADAYTPQSLKFQIGMLYLIIVSIVLAALWHQAIWLAGFFYVLFALSMIPFIGFALKRDKKVGIASIGILHLRAVVFGGGIIAGLTRGKGRLE